MGKKNSNKEVKIFKEGEVFSNFKELFIVLHWEKDKSKMSGNTKKKLVKQLETLCSFHKIQGTNKIMIDEIYKNKKITKNHLSKVEYFEPMEELFLSSICQNTGEVIYTLSYLAKQVGLINHNYNYAKKYQYNFSNFMKTKSYAKQVITEFFHSTQTIIENNIISVLNHLKKNNIIEYEEVFVTYTADKEALMEAIEEDLDTNKILSAHYTVQVQNKREVINVNSKEYEPINNIIEEVLEEYAQKYNISQSFSNWRELTKAEHFKKHKIAYIKEINTRLAKRLGIVNSYYAYEITINMDSIKDPTALILSPTETSIKQAQVNEGFKDKIATNIKNRNKVALTEYKTQQLKNYYIYRTLNSYIEDCNRLLQIISDLNNKSYRLNNKTLSKYYSYNNKHSLVVKINSLTNVIKKFLQNHKNK